MIMMPRQTSFYAQLIQALPSALIGFVFSYILYLLYAKLMPVSEYGAFGFWLSNMQILMVLTCLGFNRSIIKFFALYQRYQQVKNSSGLFLFTTIMVLSLSIIFGFLAYYIAEDSFHPDSSTYRILVFGLWVLPLFAFIEINTAIFRGFGLSMYALIPSKVILNVVAVMLSVYLLEEGEYLNAHEGIIVIALALIFVVIVQWLCIYCKVPSKYYATEQKFEIKVWLKTVLPMFISGACYFIISKVSPVLINFFSNEHQNGLYFVALQLSLLIELPRLVIVTVVVNKIPVLYSEKKHSDIQILARKSNRFVLVTSGGLGVLLVIFGHEILHYLGKDYAVAYRILIVLVAARFIASYSPFATQLLNLTGHQLIPTIVFGITLIINIILNIFFIWWMGIMGAALALLLSFVIAKLILNWLVLKHLKIN